MNASSVGSICHGVASEDSFGVSRNAEGLFIDLASITGANIRLNSETLFDVSSGKLDSRFTYERDNIG